MSLYGWEDVAQQLSTLSRQGRWGEMPALINDEMLSEVAIVCKSNELPDRLLSRYQDSVDRLGLYLPFLPGERESFWKNLLQGLKED
jgi:hypothetical protein